MQFKTNKTTENVAKSFSIFAFFLPERRALDVPAGPAGAKGRVVGGLGGSLPQGKIGPMTLVLCIIIDENNKIGER